MSWDEKLFRWSLKLYEKIVSKGDELERESQGRVDLEDLAPRLKIIASALIEETIEIKEAESVGGLYGSTLLLPSSLNIASRIELNVQAYIFRVVYSAVARTQKFILPEKFQDSLENQLFCSVLVAPKILREVEQQYPVMMAPFRELSFLEINRRNKSPIVTSTRAGAFDFLVQSIFTKLPLTNSWLDQAVEWMHGNETDTSHVAKKLFPKFLALKGDEEIKFPLFLSLLYDSLISQKQSIKTPAETPIAKGSLASGTERKAKAREKIKEIKFSENKEGENPIVHAFEKLKSAADYTGGRKSLDGSDELEEHLEALEELDLRNVIRTHDRTDSVFKADVMLESTVADLEETDEEQVAEFSYDEWDEAKRCYKRDWCKVFSSPAIEYLTLDKAQEYIQQVALKNQRQVRELRQMFDQIKSERRWRNRQIDGPEIDLDAVVDRYATVRSGSTPKDKLYLSRRRVEKDYATLILLDSSLSTDSWIENRRVMDILKESMLIVSEVIPPQHIGIGAFYSNTRKDCRYIDVKKFDEAWALGKHRLVGLKPTGYTRIGPALRHATYLLSKVPARKKLLLLISDGKPTDFDKYEGKYGIGDIRQAIREASAENVTTRALAIDVNAKLYLPQMFGAGNFQILPHPGLLSKSLAEVFSWLMV